MKFVIKIKVFFQSINLSFTRLMINRYYYIELRARSKITSHFPISASGHLRLPLNREVIEIVHYSSGFTQSQQPNLTQI